MSYLPLVLFWGIALCAFVSRGPLILYVFFGSIPFAAFAALPPGLTGGLTFIPAPLVAILLVLRAFLAPGGVGFLLGVALRPRAGFWLFLTLVVAVLTSLLMPRLLAGSIEVIPFRGVLSSTEPLRPSRQNLSQLVYLSISIFTVFAFMRLLGVPRMRRHALYACATGGAILAVTGILDFLTQYLPLEPALAPFRTATYALITDLKVFGSKRVVGLTPEASAFGVIAMQFLVALHFLRRAMPDRFMRERAVPALVCLLLVLVWLSKSTAAYVGVALFGAVAAGEWLVRLLAARRGGIWQVGLRTEFWTAFAALMVVAMLVLVEPSVLDPFVRLIDRMVLQKADSQSFHERGLWRATAWEAFLASRGFGIGVGSTRASSHLVGLLSNIGIAGTLAYLAFVLQTFGRRAPAGQPVEAAILMATRLAYVPPLIVSAFIGSANFGLMTAFLLGLANAVALPRAARRGSPVAPLPAGRSTSPPTPSPAPTPAA